MEISVVVPCYRSGRTLPELVARLQHELPGVADRFEIILVVDGSPDDTFAVARELENGDPEHLRTLLLRRNYGQHNALLAGLSRVRYDITLTMDDDLQHRPEEIPALVAPLADPLVDLVYGVATEEEHGFFRSLASRVVKGALAMAGVPNARSVSAFRAFRTNLREGFEHVADPFVSLDVVLSWTTTAVERVDVRMDQRTVGSSSYTLRALVRHAFNMVTGYGTVPLKLVTWLGLACSVFGFGLLVFVLVSFVRGEVQVAGFTTLASMIALFSGAMMLSIGILGEYLGRLHFRSMQRPTFLVRVDSHDEAAQARPPMPVVEDAGPDEIAAALLHRVDELPAT